MSTEGFWGDILSYVLLYSLWYTNIAMKYQHFLVRNISSFRVRFRVD